MRGIILAVAAFSLFASMQARADGVALYRFRDGTNHFYTADCAKVPAQGQYCYTGIEGYLASTPGPDTKPLHRLYNGVYYLYSWTEAEWTDAIKNGYKDEGIEGYVSTTPGKGKTALYRSWHIDIGDRILSTDKAEVDGGVPKDVNPDMFGTYNAEPLTPVYIWTAGKNQCSGRPVKGDKAPACTMLPKSK